MNALPIREAGDPILNTPSQILEIKNIVSPEIQLLIQQMIETMKAKGGVGIAAPQVGIDKRIFVYGFESSARYPKEPPIPITVFINPVIKNKSVEQNKLFEGCLSLRGLRGEVLRANSLDIEGYNEQGEWVKKHAQGFEARIIQHEMDHLDGILIIERVQDFNSFGFIDILQKNKRKY